MPVRDPREVLAQHVPLAGRQIADVGCGDGAIVRWLAARGADAIGVEVDEAALREACTAAAAGGERYVRGVAQALPFSDRSLDALLFIHSLHHVPPEALDAALSEARRVLRVGGLLYVQEPLAEGSQFEVLREVDDETAVRALAQDALRRVDNALLAHEHEEEFETLVHTSSFEALCERFIAASPDRAGAVAAHRERLRARFTEVATPDVEQGGFVLRQPERVDVRRRV